MNPRYSAVLLLLADLLVSSLSQVPQTDNCEFEYLREGLRVDCTNNVNELRNVRLILNLQGNILSCTCGSLDFITWMLETDVVF
ncbi:uncharacterized protein [Haliotis cracherodii]|uniref:uncharacterized protein n=1 Tax=Haliotis cracherodii TaxID=6455 RepID=UPI0039ED1E5C